jgi:hypothetical protein
MNKLSVILNIGFVLLDALHSGEDHLAQSILRVVLRQNQKIEASLDLKSVIRGTLDCHTHVLEPLWLALGLACPVVDEEG